MRNFRQVDLYKYEVALMYSIILKLVYRGDKKTENVWRNLIQNNCLGNDKNNAFLA